MADIDLDMLIFMMKTEEAERSIKKTMDKLRDFDYVGLELELEMI